MPVPGVQRSAHREAVTAGKGFTPAQLAIAWVLSRGEDIIPLAGISRPARIADNLKAFDVIFTLEERAELERVFAPGDIVGGRYPDFVSKWLPREG